MISPCINNFQLNAKNCTRNACACYHWYCFWIYLFDLNLNACNVHLSSYKYNVYKPFGILVCVTWAFLDGQAISVVSPGEISTGLDCKQIWLTVTLWLTIFGPIQDKLSHTQQLQVYWSLWSDLKWSATGDSNVDLYRQTHQAVDTWTDAIYKIC